MCGIIGYIGRQKASPILIDGLLKLEYRGYDSAGIATIENDSISVMKNIGRVKNLYDLDGINDLTGTIGIAHTRWATHGKPSKENSHPHTDNSKTFAVVHNGIIENYAELKKFLENNDYKFVSDTDTEIIPNLIHYYYTKNSLYSELSFLQAVKQTCNDLKGSFALEILCKDYPENMIVVRKDSPLVIGKGDSEFYISSDIPAILPYTKDFYFLNDREFVILSRDKITFFDNNLNEIEKPTKNIQWSATSSEKNGYDDFMLKEIHEQPSSILKTIGHKLSGNTVSIDNLSLSKDYLNSVQKIFIVACGTAMHAGLGAKQTFETLCNIPVEVDIASEFRYRNPIIDKTTLCIFVSQSGETADTIAALKLAKSKGCTTIAISNVLGSSISREANYCIYTNAGPEIAVASTKAYTCQLVLLNIMAIYFAEILGKCNKEIIDCLKQDILSLPSKVENILKSSFNIDSFARKIYNESDIFFLGRGIDYAVALEGCLKLKEVSYIHSEAYASGELKHGPIALIENGITVISIITNPHLVEKSISNLREVITRGAKTLVITNQNIDDSIFNNIIRIPEIHELLSPILSIIPMQLLSYYISKQKGLDVDKPRNLAKSVTVE